MFVCPSCEGIFENVYDSPAEETVVTRAGQLYLDASDWEEWHYIDFDALADSIAANEDYNTSLAWQTCGIPLSGASPDGRSGIYTYWYDVFGVGIENSEFQSYSETSAQEEPEKWSLAIHRNNVRLNGGAAAPTDYKEIDELPETKDFLTSLEFVGDEWNEKDVWVFREKMLSGIVGNQGIEINQVLSSWLSMDIPPMPPAFTRDSRVFIVKFPNGRHAALQLQDYVSAAGVKCCLTINYKYPL